MNALSHPPLRKFQHPALQGLNEKALTAVFNAGGIRTLTADEWLFRAGDSAHMDLLVLEGSANLYSKSAPDELVLKIMAGDHVPSAMLQVDGSYGFDCMAAEPLTVLQLETAAVQQLDAAIQLNLHKNLQAATGRLFARLNRPATTQRGPATADAASVVAFLTARQDLYSGDTPLQAMLASLPKLPPYSTRLASLMNDPKASTRNIVEIARQDPSLTASVLKTVNSAYFGLTHKIKDFQHAVMMLGFNQMQQLLINIGVQSTMPNTPEFRQLQSHSMMISVLCGEISLTLKTGSAPMLSTLGILHDIGKSVVLLLRRQYAKQEYLMKLLDPDMVGMLLLREWQIPENISEALQYQGWPALLPPYCIPHLHRDSVAILHLAHCCFERLRNLQTEPVKPCPVRHWLAGLGCREQSLDEFLLGRLLPAMTARSAPLPLALQDLIKKAQQQESSAQLKEMATPP